MSSTIRLSQGSSGAVSAQIYIFLSLGQNRRREQHPDRRQCVRDPDAIHSVVDLQYKLNISRPEQRAGHLAEVRVMNA